MPDTKLDLQPVEDNKLDLEPLDLQPVEGEKKNGQNGSVDQSNPLNLPSFMGGGSESTSMSGLEAAKSKSESEEKAGRSPEFQSYKEASKPQANVDQLKQQVKEHILGDDSKLQTQEGIDAYTKKLKEKYSKTDAQQVGDYAAKVASTAPEFKQLQNYVNGTDIQKPDVPVWAPPEVRKQAEQDYKDKKKAQSEDRDAHVKLASIALEQGDPASAIAYFNKAMTMEQKNNGMPSQETVSAGGQKVASSDKDILNGLAYAHSQLGNDKEAANYYQESIKADPNDDTGFAKRGLAAIQYKQGNLKGAQDLVAQAQQDQAPADITKTDAFGHTTTFPAMTTEGFEAQGERFRYEKAHENDTRDYLNNIANGLESIITNMTPIPAMEEGFKSGVETLKKSAISQASGDNVTAGLQMAQGVLQMGMGVAMVTPEGALFNLAAGGAQNVLPEQLTKVLMQPATAGMEFFNNDPSEAAKSLASFGDLAGVALVLHGLHTGLKGVSELADKFKKNEPLTPVDVALFQKTVKEIPESTMEEAAKKVYGKSNQLEDDKLQELTDKRDALIEDHKTAKTDYAKNQLSVAIQEANDKVNDRIKEVVTGHHEEALQASEQAHNEMEIAEAKKGLKNATTDEGKAIFEAKIKELGGEPEPEEPVKRTNLFTHPESEADVTGEVNTDDHLNPEIPNDQLTPKGENKAEATDLTKFKKVNTSDNDRAVKMAELAKKGEGVNPAPLKIEGEAENLLNTLDMKAEEGKPETPEMEAKAINGPDGEPFKSRMEKLRDYMKGKDDEAFITHNKVKRAIEALDKFNTDGKWNDQTTEEFLKSNEDATKIKGADALDVQPETKNGKGMGEGNTDPEKPAGEGEPKEPKEKEFRKGNQKELEHNDITYTSFEHKGKVRFMDNGDNVVPEQSNLHKTLTEAYEKKDGEDKFIAKFINSGMLDAKGDVERMDLKGEIEPKDIPAAIEEIKAGGKLSPMATRLKAAILKTRETGQFPAMEGMGGKARSYDRPLTDYKEQLDEAKDHFEKEEPEEKPFKEQKTGIKNKIVEKERQAQYKELLDKKFLSQSDKEIFDNAFDKIDKGWNPRDHAQEFADNPQTMTAEQQAAFMIDRVKIQNELTDIDNKINEAKSLGEDYSDLTMQRSELDKAMDLNDRAVTYAGTKLSAAFRIRQVVMGHDFSYERLRKNYFHDNPLEKEIPKYVQEKLKAYDAKVQDLKEQLKKSQEKSQEAEGKEAIGNIKEKIDRDKTKEKTSGKTYTTKAKEVADNIRKLKGKPFEFRDANGNVIKVTAMGVTGNHIIESIASLVEEAGKATDTAIDIARHVKEAIEKTLNDAKWYTELSKADKDAVNKQIKQKLGYKELKEKADKEIKKEEPVKVKGEKGVQIGIQARVRELVEGGMTDINEVVKTIHGELVKDHPELDERKVRDEITKYGKQINMSKDEITTQVNRLKREGVLISKLEDAMAGERPARKLIDKDKPTDRERAMTRQLNELLKELPPDETEDYRKIKSASDAKVTRLTNQITDLTKQIKDLREGIEPEKTTKKAVVNTPEIIDLEKKRNDLLNEVEALNGKQELTDKEYIDKWKERAKSSISKYEEKIANKDYSVKPKRELVHDKESADILGQLEAVKKQYKAEREADKKNARTTTVKLLDTLTHLVKGKVMTSLAIFGKLFSFTGTSSLMHIPEHLIGKLFAAVPYFGELARETPIHGGKAGVFKPLVKYFSDLFNPIKFGKNSWDTFIKGQTELGAAHSEYMKLPLNLRNGWDLIEAGTHIPTKFHALMHDPLIRAKYEAGYAQLEGHYNKSFEENMNKAIERGENPTDPHFLVGLQNIAYANALNESLLGKNWISEGFKAVTRNLESKNKAGGHLASSFLKMTNPVVSVGGNFINAAIDYTGVGGLAKAAINLIHGTNMAAENSQTSFIAQLLHHSITEIPIEQREALMKHFNRGMVGLGLVGLGYSNSDKIDPIKNIYFGVQLPKWFHTPIMSAIAIGAYWKQYNLKTGLFEETKELIKKTPTLEGANRFYGSVQSEEGMMKYWADFLNPIPYDARGLLPENNKPKTMIQTMFTHKTPETDSQKNAKNNKKEAQIRRAFIKSRNK